MAPLATVVIPTFRRPEATVRAVKSALNQTLTDAEIIVVDDCSGDGTPEAVEALGEKRVRVLRQEKNRGAAAARNRGILDARSEYIALLDSDDELLPASLEKRIECLKARPDSPFVYSRNYYRVSAKLQRLEPPEPFRPGDRFIDALIVTRGFPTSAMMARAECLKKCLFDEKLALVDDWDVALNLARLGPVSFVDEPLSIIHGEDESEGGRITFGENPEEEDRILSLHRAAFDESPRAEAALLYKLAMRAVRAGKKKVASDYLLRVCALDPAHQKARVILRLLRLGLSPLLPTLLRLRWKWMLATRRV